MKHSLALLACLPLLACSAVGGRTFSLQEPSLEQVFERVHGSVVTIYTVGRSGLVDASGQVAMDEGLGSGTLIDDQGHILTASHVVQTADVMAVEFAGGEVVQARVVSSVPTSDVALLQLMGNIPAGVEPVQLGNSNLARVASRVFVVGAPLGASQTLTVGYLSARRMAGSLIGMGGEVEVLQTDAAINPGNSGGPLFNLQGEVIGVVSYILSESGSSAGLGFAVSARTVREQLLERKPFWSGVDYVYIGEPYSAALNLPRGKPGLLVQRVAKNSGGERLGLRGGSIAAQIGGQPLLIGGDVVLSVLGVPVEKEGFFAAMGEAFDALPEDGSVELVVLRSGRERTLKAKLSELSAEPSDQP